jgi:two-component system, NtrC family, sensor histidine kinase HydH
MDQGRDLVRTTEPESWKRQETIFCILQLIVLAVLLLVHTLFAAHFGIPSRRLLTLLAGAFLLRVLQLLWIQGFTEAPSWRTAMLLSWWSVLLNLGLAFTAAFLTDRADSQYFVLLVMPVIESAFRFSLPLTLGVLAVTAALNFAWILHYAQEHGPVPASEYFEAGSMSMIFGFVGILVWSLVNSLRSNETQLAKNLLVLKQTQDELVREQKLAAIGRLSAAIAHEIRNPVAMISSSLATAVRGQLAPDQRERMFAIASAQAERLERLTNDFLAYARPRPLVLERNNVAWLISCVGELSQARAEQRKLKIEVDSPGELYCQCDPTVVQQALLNLVMNAIDASPPGSAIRITGRNSDCAVNIDVENSGPEIDRDAVEHMFEPFFTTKPEGTGLGLAIARSGARSHGGDLTLSSNGSPVVRFTLRLPAHNPILSPSAG